MKLVYSVRMINAKLSHPTWVRGLKHHYFPLMDHAILVAPYVGAWIET